MCVRVCKMDITSVQLPSVQATNSPYHINMMNLTQIMYTYIKSASKPRVLKVKFCVHR